MMNNDETYDEMMMKPMMKLGEDCFKMFSAHDRLLGPSWFEFMAAYS